MCFEWPMLRIAFSSYLFRASFNAEIFCALAGQKLQPNVVKCMKTAAGQASIAFKGEGQRKLARKRKLAS